MMVTSFICDECEREITQLDAPYSLRATDGGAVEIVRGLCRNHKNVCDMDCLKVLVGKMVSRL